MQAKSSSPRVDASLSKLNISPGYFRGLGFLPEDLDALKALIRAKWLARLESVRPDMREVFRATPTERYHEICELVDHASVWNKDSRLFSKEEVQQIQSMSLFKALEDALGPFEVADIEGLGRPEIYWRIVRPGQAGDVSGPHADTWFYQYTNNMTEAQQTGLIKVWIAVNVEPGMSGLAVMDDSHLKDWPNHAEVRHGRPKPVLDVDPADLDLVCVDTAPGEAIVFNIRLLHAGIPHTGAESRISMEFAIRLLG